MLNLIMELKIQSRTQQLAEYEETSNENNEMTILI